MRATFMRRLALLFFLLPAVLAIPAAAVPDTPLILVSIDGFRWDYLQKYPAPALKALAADGVHARRLTPSFPSKTFPNHYTLVTGLRPEHHGIVSNYFFDPLVTEPWQKRTVNRSLLTRRKKAKRT